MTSGRFTHRDIRVKAEYSKANFHNTQANRLPFNAMRKAVFTALTIVQHIKHLPRVTDFTLQS
jgi:hypothetical protein